MNILKNILHNTPKGTGIIINAETEAYPEIFALQIIKNVLTENKKIVYASFHPRSRRVMQSLGKHQNHLFKIIEMNFGQDIVAEYSCSSQLYEVNITLRNIRKEFGPEFIIVDSLNSLIAYNDVKDVLKFFIESIEEAVKFNTIELFIFDNRTQPENISRFLNSISNGIINLTTDNRGFTMHICKIVGTDFIHETHNYKVQIDNSDYWNSSINF